MAGGQVENDFVTSWFNYTALNSGHDYRGVGWMGLYFTSAMFYTINNSITWHIYFKRLKYLMI